MKKFKIYGLLILGVLSFYLTDKIMIYLENQNPLMQEIKAKSYYYETIAVNALINDNTIIPGLNGRKVNLRKSYQKMGDFGSFNDTFLIFEAIIPTVSLTNHHDKIIVNANSLKRAVSFVLEPYNKSQEYLESREIPYTLIANLHTKLILNRDYINGESITSKASDLHALLNKNKLNQHLCLVGYSNLEFCQQKKYYIVAPSLDTNLNTTMLLSKIKSGDIILIRANTSVDKLSLMIKEIYRQDLTILPLSSLISENN